MSLSLNEQIIIAALFHDIGKTIDIENHPNVPLIKEFPSPIKQSIEKHHDRNDPRLKLNISLEKLNDKAKTDIYAFLLEILVASDRISSAIEKADVSVKTAMGNKKKLYLNYPLIVNPLKGSVENKETPKVDEQKLKDCIKEACSDFNGFIKKLLEDILTRNGKEEPSYFLSLLKNYPNDTRYPSNDTSLLSHTLTTMAIANFLYNASISQDYRLSCIVCEISADDWLSRISRTNEFNSKEKCLHESLTQVLRSLSEEVNISMHPLTTMMMPALIDGKEFHVVTPWIFVMCESLREKFINIFGKVFLKVCQDRDLVDVLRFRLFSVTESGSVATPRTLLKNIVENGKKRLMALIKEAMREKGRSEYTYRLYSPVEENLLNLEMYKYDLTTKLGEMRLCEYCGRRPPEITDKKLGRIACRRCQEIVGQKRGVLIDDISDDDRLIAIVGFKMNGLDDILFWERDGPRMALGNPFSIAGKSLDWFPGRMCERIHELCKIGERLKKILCRSLEELIQEGLVGNKYHANVSGEIIDEITAKVMTNSFLEIEFNGITRACWLEHSDDKKVILNLFGLTDEYKKEIEACNKAILRNAEFETNLQIEKVLDTYVVRPQQRVWQIVNRLNLRDTSLTTAYIIPAGFTFSALTKICDVLREYRIDDRVGINGILTKIERENYPLYMLIEDALRVA